MKLSSVVIDSNNAEELSEFYKNLLGWEKKVYNHSKNGDWIVLVNKDESTTRLVFQQIDNYIKPVWPEEKDKQQQMLHLDFYSNDVDASVKHAIKCGATLADYQSGDWKVLIDPAGHPFCIVPTRQNRMD
jgi:catechol 2,3-dioxygenase-like lactoylglutathione lyase family enzyme